jgi:hypothetical protein
VAADRRELAVALEPFDLEAEAGRGARGRPASMRAT